MFALFYFTHVDHLFELLDVQFDDDAESSFIREEKMNREWRALCRSLSGRVLTCVMAIV